MNLSRRFKLVNAGFAMCGIHAMNKGLAVLSLDMNLLVVFVAIYKDRNIIVAARGSFAAHDERLGGAAA